MCEALEREEWLDDERFQSPAARFRNVKIRLEMTAEVLRTKTSAEWLERLDAHQVPSAPVLTRPEVITQEQVQVNELIFEYDHPGLGRVRQPRSAALFDGTPPGTKPLNTIIDPSGEMATWPLCCISPTSTVNRVTGSASADTAASPFKPT